MFFSKGAERATYHRRYLWTAIVLVGIVVAYYVLEVVIWVHFRGKQTSKDIFILS